MIKFSGWGWVIDLNPIDFHRKTYLKTGVPTTERSKVQSLLTMMCAQNVRRQLRDQQAGISGLSRQPFPLSNQPISIRIPANIQRRSTPNNSFSSSFSSRITGTSTTGSSWKMSKTWRKFKSYWISQ